MTDLEIVEYLSKYLFGETAVLDYIKNYHFVLERLCQEKDVCEVGVSVGAEGEYTCSLLYFSYYQNFDEPFREFHLATSTVVGRAVCEAAMWYLKNIEIKNN